MSCALDTITSGVAAIPRYELHTPAAIHKRKGGRLILFPTSESDLCAMIHGVIC